MFNLFEKFDKYKNVIVLLLAFALFCVGFCSFIEF